MATRWTLSQAQALFDKPFLELMFEAQQIHRQHFDPRQVQVSTLLSIKTGACPEDCKYCPQSSRYKTGLTSERLMEVEEVLSSARKAKAAGSGRFCMGAAWKNPHERDMPYLEQMVQGVKAMGMETCMTLGTLSEQQAQRLAHAGLDFYNHNLDTSPEFYGSIITTRSYQERLDPVASSGWEKQSAIVLACWCSWPTCQPRRRACQSICWSKSKAPRWRITMTSIPSILYAPLRWRAS